MKKLDILYEDKEFLVVNKPSGVLSIATEHKKTENLYHQAREYVKKQNPKNKIFIVHRLDKDTSGVLLFVKQEWLKKELQNTWNETCKREYRAIVEGTPEKKKDHLVHYLKETKNLFVYVTNDKTNGKKAITNYELIQTNGKRSLLKVTIETGRKNQIRAQLSYIGHPIVGDKKYHAKKANMFGLHAQRLSIVHPKTKKELIFTANPPKEFEMLGKESQK